MSAAEYVERTRAVEKAAAEAVAKHVERMRAAAEAAAEAVVFGLQQLEALKAAAEKAAVERAAAEKAVALGLLQPLEALSLDADTLSRVTAAAIAYCDHQGAASFADLVERASTLIAPHVQAAP